MEKEEDIPEIDIEAYKDWEKRAEQMFGNEFKDQNSVFYWKLYGEAESVYGEVILFETKDTLLGNVKGLKARPEYLKNVLQQGQRECVALEMPEKCPKCDFSRFFAIKISETSIGKGIIIECPNCKKFLKNIENNW